MLPWFVDSCLLRPVPRIILDTDLAMGAPGADIDDGFALALAHADPDIQLDLITTVHGNTDVQSATLLTGELIRRLGLRVPVVTGAAAAALARPGSAPAPGQAAAAIADHVMAHPGEITIVAIGPLTNVAAALALEPRLVGSAREIVVMGGSFFGTAPNRELPGEFNVTADPEAAQAVLRSGLPQRWVGLDVTLRVRLTREHARRLLAADTPFAAYAGAATLSWIDRLQQRNAGHADSCALHDPLAVAVLTRPDLVSFRPAEVSVVTEEGPERGVTVTRVLDGLGPGGAACRVAATVDAEAALDHVLGLIGRW